MNNFREQIAEGLRAAGRVVRRAANPRKGDYTLTPAPAEDRLRLQVAAALIVPMSSGLCTMTGSCSTCDCGGAMQGYALQNADIAIAAIKDAGYQLMRPITPEGEAEDARAW